DVESGIDTASGQLLRASAPLADGTCGSFGAFGAIATGPGASSTDTGVASANCYRYEYRAFDRAGNTSTSGPSSIAKVDTTAPSAPSVTLAESSPLEYTSGTTFYYNAQGS